MTYDDDYLDDARDQARLMSDDGPDDAEPPARRVNDKGWIYIKVMADDGPDDGEPPVRRVNTKGWIYIKEWILATKNEDQEYLFDSRAEEAWCSEAEESMGNGNPPIIEMPANATKSGSFETFTVPDDGVYECDSEPGICPACSGSGEGMHEGTTCSACKGAGEC